MNDTNKTNKAVTKNIDNDLNTAEKTYTLKSIHATIAKIEKKKENNKEKIKQLTKEINSYNAKIKELEGIYDKLYKEDIQRQLEIKWFKDCKMTAEEVAKFIELGKKLHEKINILDIDEVIEAVELVQTEKNK